MSVTSPPMMNDGRNSAAARISISIEVVDVLPCVPATPSDFDCAQIDDSIPARLNTAIPLLAASSSSMFFAGTAVDAVTAEHPATRRRS